MPLCPRGQRVHKCEATAVAATLAATLAAALLAGIGAPPARASQTGTRHGRAGTADPYSPAYRHPDGTTPRR